MDVSTVRDRLRGVRWIGGGSGAGKSTVAAALAERHGLRLFSTDEAMADHARRCPPGECPRWQEFAAMSVDERWVDRSPREMLETFHWYRGEGFPLIVEDLLAEVGDDGGRGVLVEGFRLLPRLVRPLLADPARAVWLLPTPGFRRAAFEHRGGTWRIAGRTGDPERALANLLERDRLFTGELRAEVAREGLRAVEVDTSWSLERSVRVVAAALGLPPVRG